MSLAGTSSQTLELPSEAGLRAARDIATSLREAITSHSAIALDTSMVTSADLTTIQTLLAAKKLADNLGKSLSLAGPPQGALRALLIELGFLDQTGEPLADGAAFWTATPPLKSKAQ